MTVTSFQVVSFILQKRALGLSVHRGCLHLFLMSVLIHVEPTCRENARSAGMGTRAAMKKAIMLLTDVRATLVPVRRKQSPVRSLKEQKV